MPLDPNQDDNMDDRADIIVIDGLGSGAFYAEDDAGPSAPIQDILILRNISALGSLVVTAAGRFGEFPSYHALSWLGATPEAEYHRRTRQYGW